MVTVIGFIAFSGLLCVVGVVWVVRTAKHDSPYATKTDDPIPPIAGPERPVEADAPLDITGAFEAYDSARREQASEPAR